MLTFLILKVYSSSGVGRMGCTRIRVDAGDEFGGACN